MNADEFIHAVRVQTPAAFAQSVALLTEVERKPLSKTAQKLLAEGREADRKNFGVSHAGLMGRLAVLAVGPRSAAVKAMPFTPSFEDPAVQILIDRRPEWIADWLQVQLDGDFPRLKFESIQRLIREGGCPKPASRGYAMAFSTSGVLMQDGNDADVIEDLWLLFEHDVSVFIYFPELKSINRDEWRQESRPKPHEAFWSFPRRIYYYAHHGMIDRSRVLEETVAALWRDFNATSRPGLMRMHELFEPTSEERANRQGAYRELLQHSVSAVVGFGLQMLKSIQKDGALDADLFVESVPAVLTQKTKGHPLAALSLLKSIVKENAQMANPASAVAIRALGHAAADVQESALSLLEAWSPSLNADIAAELAEQGSFVSAKFKDRLEALIERFGPVSSTTSIEANQTESIGTDISGLQQRTAALPDDLRSAYEIEAALQAIEHGEMVLPLDVEKARSVLAELQPIEPIRDLDELIDCVSRAVEVVESPVEIERIISAICLLFDDRPSDFEERTQALLKRLEEFQPGFSMDRGLMSIRAVLPTSMSLILYWLYGDNMKPAASGWVSMFYRQPVAPGGSPVQRLVNHRLAAIRNQLKNGQRSPLLSLPTHEHGWIDPRTFVERLRLTLDAGQQPSHLDVTFGLLRLAPDFKVEAIEQSRALPDPFGRLVRYALGAEETISRGDQEWANAWLAAGRTRSPRGTLPELECLKYPTVTNAIEPAEILFDWKVDTVLLEQRMYLHRLNEGIARLFPMIEENVVADTHPTIAISQEIGKFAVFGSLSGWAEEWLASLWPANSDCFLAMAIDRLIMRVDAPGSTWFNMGNAIRPLLASERNWSSVGVLTLWVGLLSKDAEVRAIARDALAGGMQDGRAHPQSLAHALIGLTDKSWFKLNRLAESLRDVARVSSWAALVTAEILDRLIASWIEVPRDAHHVLELQLDLLTELKSNLSESARSNLAQQTVGGKTGKLVRQLCALRSDAISGEKRAALNEGVEVRISRAERIAAFRSLSSEICADKSEI